MDYSEWKFQQLKGNTEQSYDELGTASKFGFLTVAFCLWAMFLFVENWLLMIFIGTLHSVFSSIPAAGFWTVLWFNILLGIIFNVVKRNLK